MSDDATTPFTIQNLDDVKDMAPDFGLAETGEARFANGALETEATGVSMHRVKPDARQPFGHVHDKAEEVYVVLAGAGRINLDGNVKELKALDAVRVSPKVKRAFEAGPEGMTILACGPHHEGDGEVLQGWWG